MAHVKARRVVDLPAVQPLVRDRFCMSRPTIADASITRWGWFGGDLSNDLSGADDALLILLDMV
jgi:hypothetical protein